MYINPLMAIDFYKADHRRQYPKGTTEVYANFTSRSNAHAQFISDGHEDKVVMFGLQYFLSYFLGEIWQNNFFDLPKEKVVANYKRRMDTSLGEGSIPVDHIEALHDLGYLPLKIKALPEGVRVPIGVPPITIKNTLPEFFWLTNYIESVMSCFLWKPMTSATTAFEYKRLLQSYAKNTGTPLDFVMFQGHDFSFRGMSFIPDAAASSAGHLTSFFGTDTVPAIDFIEQYYMGDATKSLIAASVPATEHSVMCMGEQDNELGTFKRLITETYPSGIVSIVSDTWDFWKVVTEYVSELKGIIMERDGKVVIRPDSGDPVKIICGDPDAPVDTPEHRGAVQCLWDIFGGTETETGHKLLDEHIGLIYGDSITLGRAQRIMEVLKANGFASGNVVLGIGSYTYEFVTRDNHGSAMKATSGVVNGERRDIFKDPKTDSGFKKSAKGLLRVEKEDDTYVLYDQQTPEQEEQGELKVVYYNGTITRKHTFEQVRQRLADELK
jgi:nicotinamide phosphoribosyltransferase